MTEEQAKTKICCGPPLTVGVQIKLELIKRTWFGGKVGTDVLYCCGSQCMAWRWTHGGPSNPPDSGDPGYCGLAGPVPYAS